MADLRDKKIPNLQGNTFVGYVSQLVSQSGLASQDVQESLAAQEKVLVSVQNQRDSVSGVSLDEEAINLMQLQRAYQASSRFVHLVDGLLDELMNMIR
jgi:flagellar hook-associated protein 1 FlgK